MVDYNISAVRRRAVFSGSAGVGPYACTFEILTQTDIQVYKNTTLLTLTTDYTVSINSNGTFSVTLVVAATGSDTVTVAGARSVARTTDFVTAGDLRASALNDQLDALTIYDQQMAEQGERSIKFPITDSTTLTATLPIAATRANKLLVFDASGNVTTSTETLANIEGSAASAAAAAASAATATTQAGLASTARIAAELAETNAETAETNAETAETNAATSATNAASAASSVAVPWNFEASTTMAAPSTGGLRFNNATVASVTAIAVNASTADAGNPDLSDFVATWDDSTNATIKSTLTIRKRGTPATFAVFTVSAVTDNTTWLQLTVAHVASGGTWSAADVAVVGHARTGDKGTDGAGSVVSVTAGDSSITIAGTGANPTVAVAAGGTTNAKLATMAANTVKANATAGSATPTDVALAASQLLGRGSTGNIAAITLGTGLSMSGTTLSGSATSPFSASYTSADQTITSAGTLTLAHGLGGTPTLIQSYLKCTTAEFGYSIGDVFPVNNMVSAIAGNNNKGVRVVPDGTNLNIGFGANASAWDILGKTTLDGRSITNTSWAYFVRAWR